MTTEALAKRLKRLHELAKEVLGDVRRWAGVGLLHDMGKRAAVVAVTDAVDACEAARIAMASAAGIGLLVPPARSLN